MNSYVAVEPSGTRSKSINKKAAEGAESKKSNRSSSAVGKQSKVRLSKSAPKSNTKAKKKAGATVSSHTHSDDGESEEANQFKKGSYLAYISREDINTGAQTISIAKVRKNSTNKFFRF